MIYVTQISTVSAGGRRRSFSLFARSVVKVVARVSTKPHDHRAPKKHFNADAWARLMRRPDVMHRHHSGAFKRSCAFTHFAEA